MQTGNLRRHPTKHAWRLCTVSAGIFSAISHRNSSQYASIPASFLCNLSKNLLAHLPHKPCGMPPALWRSCMNKIRSIQPESLWLPHYSAPCALCSPCHAGCTHPDRSAPHADRQPQAASHKARLAALHSICWHIFRHITQKLLAIRKYSCVVSMQSVEKSTGASAAQALWDAACPVEELHE